MGSGKPKTGRKRLHDKKKKKWKKGHSSESNPEAKKHRQAAKNRFFTPNTGPSSLTVEAVAKHNEAGGASDMVVSEVGSDSQSVGARTFSTWASNWTECTNTTFSRVHRFWHSNSALHKEMLAVLAAVTEVIKGQGGRETETEYFAALMTTMDTVEEPQSLAAVAYLLSLVIKRVPVTVLKARFSEVAKALLDTLAAHAESDVPALIRSLIMCLASLLRVQEQAVWSSASTMQIYHGLLSFITHSKPKVRKAAQEAVRAILKGSIFMTQGDPPPFHPVASATAKYCIQQIEECGVMGEATATLHTLGLLKDVLGVFPQNSLKSTCETILRAMTLSNVMVTSVCMQALHGMFSSKPKVTSLPADLNAQIIRALYDYQPGENDVQPTGAWLAVQERAHINLARLDEKLCISHLPRFFSSCMTCMQGEKPEISQMAANTLKVTLRECLHPMSEQLETLVKLAPEGTVTAVHKMFKAVETGLSYQYHASWGHILQILTVFFEILGKSCHGMMGKCLLSMADLRDSYRFPYKIELDQAVGMAVRTMGPKIVLASVPLNITGEGDDYDFPRSWLLPVLRDNIQETELAFFVTYFLPLAAKLRTKSMAHAEENKVVESKTYDALQLQIWSLLPGFCTKCTDIEQSFSSIAKILGSAISDRPDLRVIVMSSLRKLINQNLDHSENRSELGKFAKNFLPLLFNLFTTETEYEKDSQRQAVLETCKTYMQITDSKLICGFFDKCYNKLTDVELEPFKRHALLDLLMTMIPYISEDRCKQLYSLAQSQLDSTDRNAQKKCYRILEELCAGKSEASKSFVTSSLKELQECLLKSLSSSSPSSKAPRLRCLINIFEQLEEQQMDFLMAVVPEAILCTKEVAERARVAAYHLLVKMGHSMIRWSELPELEVIEQYFQVIMAGLAGSPHMVATTVLALTRILYEFKASVSSELLTALMDAICLLLTSKAREIVVSTLGLVKVTLGAFPETALAQFLQQLVCSLVSIKEDNRHHLRFKVKEIFGRLIRKFGYPMVHGMVPESLHKLLVNIRKEQERSKKKKQKRLEEESDDEEPFSHKQKIESINELLRDTDSEVEEDTEEKRQKGKKKVSRKSGKAGAAWLKEAGEEDIMDFMDPSASKKVLATKPVAQDKEKQLSVKHAFKTAPDGRLIIHEESDSEEEVKRKGKSKEAEVDDLDELLEAMGQPKKSRKRKLSIAEDLDEEDTQSRYQAGGSGIHRPIAVAAKKKGDTKRQKTSELGGEYKAKKAGGDMKRKGKPDPYAYVPLDIQNLNRRKKAKFAGQFRNLVRGAKKGAQKGQKMKHRKR